MGIGLGALGLTGIGAGGYCLYLSNSYASQYKSAGTREKADDYFAKKNSALAATGVCALCGTASIICGIVVYRWKPESTKQKRISIAPMFGMRNGALIVFSY